MLTYPDISPVAVDFGPVAIHWYGLTYLFGFIAVWWLGGRRARRPDSGWTPDEVADMLFYGALGVILGGRVGYILFYNFNVFIADPLMLLRIWQGGMSFHGGMLGVFVAMWLFGRKTGRTFFQVTDFMAPFVPIGLGAGRIGNFINGELWGRPTELPWGMVFGFVDQQPRHPSMLYEALLEGLLLFIILWLYSSKPRPLRAVSGMFMLFYGLFRFSVEFVRQPDAHLGFIAFDWLTMGHLLSAPMILYGIYLLFKAYSR
ncbi:Prolipoprotein diacylglyceryl transferase [hydrothermal vent metagenome]|uniref:Prolipoprotein diacylglyceryl transferase n=1 Tax=hydrothermal vent metagenome TaxID=652676 RepID=A0A3B0Z5N1_9ZZZZ